MNEFVKGTLGESGGCVALSNGDKPGVTLIWPTGVTLALGIGNTWSLLTSDGRAMGSLGQLIHLDGDIVDRSTAAKVVDNGVPASCSRGTLFLIRHVVQR
jgi:hypothetical protein